jgi:hypothetical protein
MVRDAMRMLGGSVVIYVVMAACSAQEAPRRGDPTAGSGGSAGASSQGGSGGVGGSGMVADAAGGNGGAFGIPDATAGAGGAGGIDRPDVAEDLSDARAGDERPGVIDALLDPVRDADAQTTSGTRIKAKWLVTADGARQPNGWYDSMRKEDCFFSAAGDGKMRCIAGIGGGAASILFTDAGCSLPMAAVPAPTDAGCQGAVAQYGVFYQVAGCPAVAQYRVFSVGAMAATPSAAFQKSGVTCSSVGSPASYRWYAVTEIAPTEFVEGVVQTDP